MSRYGRALDGAHSTALAERYRAEQATKERDRAVAELADCKAKLREQLVAAYREGWAHRDLGRSPSSESTVAAILAGGAL